MSRSSEVDATNECVGARRRSGEEHDALVAAETEADETFALLDGEHAVVRLACDGPDRAGRGRGRDKLTALDVEAREHVPVIAGRRGERRRPIDRAVRGARIPQLSNDVLREPAQSDLGATMFLRSE